MREHQNMKSEARSEVLMLMMMKNIFLYFLQFKEFVYS